MLFNELYISTSMKSDDVKQLNLMIPLRVKQSDVYTQTRRSKQFFLFFLLLLYAAHNNNTAENDRKDLINRREREREREREKGKRRK